MDCEWRSSLLVLRKSETFCVLGNQTGVVLSMQRPTGTVYRRDMNWLSARDVFLAEVSGSSFGLGFETGYLLGATEKRVVLFYHRDVEQKISLLITGVTHPNCRLVPYSTIEELDALVRNSLSG